MISIQVTCLCCREINKIQNNSANQCKQMRCYKCNFILGIFKNGFAQAFNLEQIKQTFIFFNFVVVINLKSNDPNKSSIQIQIISNGGRITNDINKCTHIITYESEERIRAKYTTIPSTAKFILPEYIFDCVKSKYALPITDNYKPKMNNSYINNNNNMMRFNSQMINQNQSLSQQQQQQQPLKLQQSYQEQPIYSNNNMIYQQQQQYQHQSIQIKDEIKPIFPNNNNNNISSIQFPSLMNNNTTTATTTNTTVTNNIQPVYQKPKQIPISTSFIPSLLDTTELNPTIPSLQPTQNLQTNINSEYSNDSTFDPNQAIGFDTLDFAEDNFLQTSLDF